MNRSLKTLLLTGALGAASLTGYALADAPPTTDGAAHHGPRHGGPGGRMHMSMSDRLSRHATELGLTAQQLTAIKAAEDAARLELDRLHQALTTRREALHAQIQGILTAEQRAKLEQRMHHRRGKPQAQ